MFTAEKGVFALETGLHVRKIEHELGAHEAQLKSYKRGGKEGGGRGGLAPQY